jgi:hypothetical protein
MGDRGECHNSASLSTQGLASRVPGAAVGSIGSLDPGYGRPERAGSRAGAARARAAARVAAVAPPATATAPSGGRGAPRAVATARPHATPPVAPGRAARSARRGPFTRWPAPKGVGVGCARAPPRIRNAAAWECTQGGGPSRQQGMVHGREPAAAGGPASEPARRRRRRRAARSRALSLGCSPARRRRGCAAAGVPRGRAETIKTGPRAAGATATGARKSCADGGGGACLPACLRRPAPRSPA